MAGTFISYRREDAAGYAGRLRESLERRLGSARVFRDVDALRPGQDFVQAIESRLADCRVMLVIIGREWLDARLASGVRRLDEPYDFVRLEVAAGLGRSDVLVVPVLVEGASMPGASELPENMRPLARRQAVSIRDETWDSDVDRLVAFIDSVDGGFTVPIGIGRARKSRVWMGLGVVFGLLLVLGVARLWQRSSTERVRSPDQPSAREVASPTPAPAPYTIDIPRVAEAAFGSRIYAVVSGNVVPRGDSSELRLRIRLSNFASHDANFWTRSFRLAVGGQIVTPANDLNEIVPGNSLRYGIVTFRLPARTNRAIFRIANNQASADIPLDVEPTGRPAVDEQAEIADSMSQAVMQTVSRGQVVVLEGPQVGVALVGASTRLFVNTLRLRMTVRVSNRGRVPIHSGQVLVRLEHGDAVSAPLDEPNEIIGPLTNASYGMAFDLPIDATKAVLRATFAGKSGQVPLEWR